MTNDDKMESLLIEHVQRLMKEKLVDTTDEDAILEISKAIVREVATITPPEDPSFTMGYVTMAPGVRGGGLSRKKVNVI